MKKVIVIGGGLMGSGIATGLLLSNIHVVLKEVNSDFLSKGIKFVQGNIKGLVARGKLVQDKAEKALSLLKGIMDYSYFGDVDMVIEVSWQKFKRNGLHMQDNVLRKGINPRTRDQQLEDIRQYKHIFLIQDNVLRKVILD